MSPKDRRTIKLGGGALAAIALVWLVILPWLDDWSAARQRIDDSRQRMTDLQEQVQRLTAMDRELEPVMGAAVKKPLGKLAATRTQLIKDVMDLHMAAGVQVRSLQPEASRPLRELPGVVRLAMQVQSTCQPPQLIRILAAAKSSPSLLLVDRLDVTQGQQGPGSMNVTMVWSTLAQQEGGR